MKNILLIIAPLISASANAATANDYLRQHEMLQGHPAVIALMLDWVNDPVNKDAPQSGYDLARDAVSEMAQACLAGYRADTLNNDDCQAVVYAAGDR